MTETNTAAAALQEQETDDALANLPAATAAHLRHLRESMEAQATEGAEKWKAISARLIEQIGEQKFSGFFKDVKPAFIPANDQQPPHLRLAFKTRFLRDWIENNYGCWINAFWQHMQPSGTLEFAVQPAEEPKREQKAETLPAKAEQRAEKKGELIPFPIFPEKARAVINILARSSLFAAIQGKDRQLVECKKIETDGGNKLFFSGRELNQEDHDTLLQLIKMACHQPFGQYVTVPAHAILTEIGRKTGGEQHRQLAEQIGRLTRGSVEIDTPRVRYIGHLIDDAAQDKTKRFWVYRINPLLAECYARDAYTLIDWEGRKKLQGKALARWLQAYLITHAEPFPVKVATLWRLSGSKAKDLFEFRRALKKALDDLKGNGDIKTWTIDARDLVHVDRGDTISASQRRSLDAPQPR